MKKLGLLVLFLLCFLIIRCSPPSISVADKPILPKEVKKVEEFQPLPSVINVPLEIRTRALEQFINQQLPDPLFEADTITLGSLKNIKVKVQKGDTIRLSVTGDEITYRIPLKIWLKLSFTVEAFGLSHTEYQEVEAGIVLKFKSRLFIKNDWKIVTMTESGGYEWASDPVIKIRFLSIPIKPLADLILSREHKKFGDIVDKGLNSMVDIKKLLQPIWLQIQKPILLSQNPNIWLKLSPKAVYMTQLSSEDGVIKAAVGITTIAETFIGSEPEYKISDTLPEFTIPGKIDSTFIVNLYGEINYTDATLLLKTYLCGRSFTYGKKEVIVQDVEINGIDGYIVVTLDFIGSFKGRVYVIGRAKYDSTKTLISVEELAYDISTQNAIYKTAGWLFHGIIIDKIKPYLKFPLREKLLESQLLVQKMLCNNRITKNIYVNGFIDTLTIGGINVTDKSLRAIILAKGRVSLNMRE